MANENDASMPVHINQQKVSDEANDKPMVDLIDSVLTEEQKSHVHDFFSRWKGVFSQSPTDLGRTNLVEHEIPLKDETPFKEPNRRIPPGIIEEVREHLKEMLEIRAIRDSKSPFSSNVVIVRKKDGTIVSVLITENLTSIQLKMLIPSPELTTHATCLLVPNILAP